MAVAILVHPLSPALIISGLRSRRTGGPDIWVRSWRSPEVRRTSGECPGGIIAGCADCGFGVKWSSRLKRPCQSSRACALPNMYHFKCYQDLLRVTLDYILNLVLLLFVPAVNISRMFSPSLLFVFMTKL